MDNKIKTSLIAAAVSSVLSSTALAAPESLHTANQSLPLYDFNASVYMQNKKAQGKTNRGLSTSAVKQSAGKSTLRDHFSSEFNVKTFSWATPQDKINVPQGLKVLQRNEAAQLSAKHFATSVGGQHGVTAQALEEADLKGIHDLGRGAVIARYEQNVNGIEVIDRHISVVMNQDMDLVATSGHFAKSKPPMRPLSAQFSLAPEQAIGKAFGDLGGEAAELSIAGEKAKFKLFNATSDKFNFDDQPRAKMVYYPTAKRLIPAYMVELMITPKDSRTYLAYRHIISAEDGQILRRQSLKDHAAFTYKVFADATAPYRPFESPMGNDLTPHPTGNYLDEPTEVEVPMNMVTLEHAGISTGDPWLAEDATTTQGNNVDAYADIAAPDFFSEGDLRPSITSDKTFDYNYSNPNALDAFTVENMNSAVVNLFYVNNWLHNDYYDHGFTEVWGNAQMNNYGRGGEEGDPIHAQGLDHSGTDNANMSTPSDGFSPRMQMYVWAAPGPVDLSVGDVKVTGITASGWGQAVYDISGDMVRYQGNDGTTGCEEATNADDLKGKIAIIDRGGCEFGLKGLNAERAGAIGAIVANSDQDQPDNIFAMGGGDNGASVTIPAGMISYNAGQQVYAELEADRDAASMKGATSFRDGTVDHTIVAHEWGHYLSNRLTGGLSNNQGRAMGEGWSDFVGMLMSVEADDQNKFNNSNWSGVYAFANYALNHGNSPFAYYFGLRRAPYSTDMTYNPMTFKHIENGVALPETAPFLFGTSGANNAAVHSSGEIWNLMLWESYAGLLNKDGMSFADAQNKMKDYLVASLKMTPAAPTYTEARDAVLAAAIADDVENYEIIRAAFAKRGMGPMAVAPERFSTDHAGVVEDFGTEFNAVEATGLTMNNQYMGEMGQTCDMDDVLDVRETASLTVSLRNIGTMAVEGLKAKVTAVPMEGEEVEVEFANDGVIEFDTLAKWNDSIEGMIEAKLKSATTNQQIQFNIEFMSDDSSLQLPDDVKLSAKLHRDIVKSEDREMEDFSNLDTVWHDWSQVKIGAENTSYFSNPIINDWTVISGDLTGIGSDTIMGPDGTSETDVSLMTPVVKVDDDGEFKMSFTHYYEFETQEVTADWSIHWDGAVMEIKIDDGEWMDVVEAGGTFDVGYNGVINPGYPEFDVSPNPVLGGRNGFTAIIGAYGLHPEAITYPEGVLNGKNVQFRFRIGTDAAVGAWGWNVDDVKFENADTAAWSVVADDVDACNPPPVVTSEMMDVEVLETASVELMVTATDPEGDEITGYTWWMNGEMIENEGASYTYMAPEVAEDTTVDIAVTATDSNNKTSEPYHFNVMVKNNSAPTVTAGQSSVSVDERQSVALSVTGNDVDGDELTYTWMVDGVDVGNNSATYNYTAPRVTADTTVSVVVTATDTVGNVSEPATMTVNINNSNSGGSMGLLTLLLAPLAFIRRRKIK